MINVDQKGFQLTGPGDGVWPGDRVRFDFFGTGHKIPLSWTKQGSATAFLALDRNGNGKIDSAKELFGNITDQPPSSDPNGFLALAVFDVNHDGVIDGQDPVYRHLLLWTDKNHNGISEPDELVPLWQSGISAIRLDYKPTSEVVNGNQFRYCSTIVNTDGSDNGRITCDVFLLVAPRAQ